MTGKNKAERAQLLNGLSHEIAAGVDHVAQIAAGEMYDNLTSDEMEKVHMTMFQLELTVSNLVKWVEMKDPARLMNVMGRKDNDKRND